MVYKITVFLLVTCFYIHFPLYLDKPKILLNLVLEEVM